MKSILFALVVLSSTQSWALMAPPDEGAKPSGWGVRPDRKFHETAVPVAGTVRLRVRGIAASVSVVAGQQQLLSVKASAQDTTRVELRRDATDSYEVFFDGSPTLKSGHIVATVPPHSEVEIQTTTGAISVSSVSGSARLRSTVGDISVVRGGMVEARTISGHVSIIDADGETRIDSVSGDAQVSAARGVTPIVRFASTSGDLDWSGACGPACRIEARTMSGDVTMRLRRESSFRVRYLSHSGDFDDQLGIATSSGNTVGEVAVAGKLNEGHGAIDCNTFSGDLRFLSAQ